MIIPPPSSPLLLLPKQITSTIGHLLISSSLNNNEMVKISMPSGSSVFVLATRRTRNNLRLFGRWRRKTTWEQFFERNMGEAGSWEVGGGRWEFFGRRWKVDDTCIKFLSSCWLKPIWKNRCRFFYSFILASCSAATRWRHCLTIHSRPKNCLPTHSIFCIFGIFPNYADNACFVSQGASLIPLKRRKMHKLYVDLHFP